MLLASLLSCEQQLEAWPHKTRKKKQFLPTERRSKWLQSYWACATGWNRWSDYLVVTFCVLLLCFSQVLLQLLASPVSDNNLNAVNSREYIVHILYKQFIVSLWPKSQQNWYPNDSVCCLIWRCEGWIGPQPGFLKYKFNTSSSNKNKILLREYNEMRALRLMSGFNLLTTWCVTSIQVHVLYITRALTMSRKR